MSQHRRWVASPRLSGLPAQPLGIGHRCHIEGAIIDKNARIADGVVITPEGKATNLDAENYFIRDGILVPVNPAATPFGK